MKIKTVQNNPKNVYIDNLRQILLGQVPIDSIGMKPDTNLKKQELNMNVSEEDSTLRAEVEQESRYNLSPSHRTGTKQDKGMSRVWCC